MNKKQKIFLMKGKEDYSQNDDGSNHHDPKGGSGSPKSIQKLLNNKTGWDWSGKAENNAKKIIIEGHDYGWHIKYADGSVCNWVNNPYIFRLTLEPDINEIVASYYKVNVPSLNNNVIIPFMPIINPVPIPTPVSVPVPVFGW